MPGRYTSAVTTLIAAAASHASVAGNFITFGFTDIPLDSSTPSNAVFKSQIFGGGSPLGALTTGDLTTPLVAADGRTLGAATAAFGPGTLTERARGTTVVITDLEDGVITEASSGEIELRDADRDRISLDFTVISVTDNAIVGELTSVTGSPVPGSFDAPDGTSIPLFPFEFLGEGDVTLLLSELDGTPTISVQGRFLADIPPVPTPAGAAFAGVAGLVALRRRRG